MAPRFLISKEVAGPDGLISVSPHWVIGVARYANPVTYDPAARASITNDADEARAERPRLVITGDCVAMNAASNKDSHNASMTAELLDSGTKYINEIMPGDWVVANIVYTQDKAADIAQRMLAGEAVNKWDDGCKFVGRVASVRKRLAIDPSTGRPRSAYSLNCVAFGELNTAIMYWPQLAANDVLPMSMERFGIVWDQILHGDFGRQGLVDPMRAIPAIIAAVYGDGAWKNQRQIPGADVSGSPNETYVVPQSVFGWLGLGDKKTYADLLQPLIGLQKYDDTQDATGATPGALFQPSRLGEMIGSSPITAMPETNTSAWALISAYVNAPLNEIYATMRCDKSGAVYPTLVFRQSPYTTDLGDTMALRTGTNALTGMADEVPVPTTRFMELPRWVVTRDLVWGADIGRSEAMRVNLVYANGLGPIGAINEVANFWSAAPVKDTADIFRNGIKPYIPSVNCLLEDMVTGPRLWRDLMADYAMGQHLTLNGTITLMGVQAPIAVGDNLEWEGTVFHIETVSHSVSVGPDGRRQFMTNLSVSRGTEDRGGVNYVQPTVHQRQFRNTDSTDEENGTVATTRD